MGRETGGAWKPSSTSSSPAAPSHRGADPRAAPCWELALLPEALGMPWGGCAGALPPCPSPPPPLLPSQLRLFLMPLALGPLAEAEQQQHWQRDSDTAVRFTFGAGWKLQIWLLASHQSCSEGSSAVAYLKVLSHV